MQAKDRLPVLAALKTAVNEAYNACRMELFDDMEVGDRKTLKVNGEKVGSVIAAEGKTTLTVYDPEALLEWCRDNGYPFTVSLPSSLYSKNSALHRDGESLVTKDGEVVPGVMARQAEDYVMVKDCKPDVVLPLIQPETLLEAMEEQRRLTE